LACSKKIGLLQSSIHDIDEQYEQAKFPTEAGIPSGQATLSELLENAHVLTQQIQETLPDDYEEPADIEMRSIIRKLRNIITQLNRLKEKSEVSTIELGRVQTRLNKIDNMYYEGKFVLHGDIPEGEAYAAELLAIAHELVEEIQIEFLEPDTTDDIIDEHLVPLNHKLDRMLEQAYKLKGLKDLRFQDVGRLQNSLSKIDKRYSEAKFTYGNTIPNGQAALSEKLYRVHELVREVVMKN